MGSKREKFMNINIEEKRFVDVTTISNLLGLKKGTIYLWTSTGRLPVHKVGRLNRYRINEVLEVFKSQNEQNRG